MPLMFLSLVQAALVGSWLCSQMLRRSLGAMTPAQWLPARYSSWSFSYGNFSQNRRMALQYSHWLTSSPMSSSTPIVYPTPAGAYRQMTLAALLRGQGLTRNSVLSLVKTNSPQPYSQPQSDEQPGPGESTKTTGSFDGLFMDGVQTQQSCLSPRMSRWPAQKLLTTKGMGRSQGSTQSPSSTENTESTRTRRITHFINRDRFIKYLMTMHKLIAIVLSLLLTIGKAQVSHDALPLAVREVHIAPTVSTIPSRHDFKVEFKGLGHEIHGKVYESDQTLLDEHLYNTQAYRESTACKLEHSKVDLEVDKGIRMEQGERVEASFVSDQTMMVFLVLSNDNYLEEQVNRTKKLSIYRINDTQLEALGSTPISELGLVDQEDVEIRMLQVNKVLLITDGLVMKGINETSSWDIPVQIKIPNPSSSTPDWMASDYQLMQLQWSYSDKNSDLVKVVAVWNKMIWVYDFNLNLTHAFLVLQLTPPEGKTYVSAVIHRDFYILSQKQLITYRRNNQGEYQADFVELESSTCWGLNKYDTTLHMICKESGAHYVAEMYFNSSFVKLNQALKLNRYYTDLDDARYVFKFGTWNNPKLVIAGDDDLLMTPYAINRQVIIDADELPPMQHARSLGMEQITTLNSLSSLNTTTAIGVGTQFIALFRVTDSPASMTCSHDRDESVKWSLLVQLNTTSCFSNGDIEQLQSICRVGIPYSFYTSVFEVDSSKSLTVHLVAYAILAVIALVLLGCAFHCRGLRAKATAQLQRRLEKLKNKNKEMKPI